MFNFFKKAKPKMFEVSYITGFCDDGKLISFKKDFLERKHIEAFNDLEALDKFNGNMSAFIGNILITRVAEIDPIL